MQIEYVARTLIAPIIDRRASTIEVKATAEDQWVNGIHSELSGSVFAAGCSNWYINEYGRNAASWPGYASAFWIDTLKRRPGVFKVSAGSKMGYVNALVRWVRTTSSMSWILLFVVVGLVRQRRSLAVREKIVAASRVALARLRGALSV